MLFLAGRAERKTRRAEGAGSKRLVLALALLVATPAGACAPPPGPGVAIAAVALTGEISLADGRIVRLAGLDWPAASRRVRRERAFQALRRLSEGAEALIAPSGRPDRWGRIAAQVFLARADGPPEPAHAQAVLIGLGLAAAWPEAGACLGAMLAAEGRARAAGLGLWAPIEARRQAALLRRPAAGDQPGRIAFTGRVRSVREGRSVVFVNFEGRRETTPSFAVQKRDLARWRKEGLDPATFSGKRLRVRGLLSRAPSLRLDVSGPLAVEVLE